MNYWLLLGTLENWKEAFQNGNIWGFTEKQQRNWNEMREGDKVLFYVIRPVSGVIGYGTVKTKFRQTQPLWSQEIKENRVIWPLRIEFNVEYCLPSDKWETDQLTSKLLRYKAGVSFGRIEDSFGQEIISKFKASQGIQIEEPVTHREIKEKLIEVGKLQNFIAEDEYPFDLGRLDVVWRRVERSVPTYVFEICVRGDLYHDLSKLKHAFDLWNSRIFIVASDADETKIRNLLSGSFHEIAGHLKFISLEMVKELHMHKVNLIELEKKLGL